MIVGMVRRCASGGGVRRGRYGLRRAGAGSGALQLGGGQVAVRQQGAGPGEQVLAASASSSQAALMWKWREAPPRGSGGAARRVSPAEAAGTSRVRRGILGVLTALVCGPEHRGLRSGDSRLEGWDATGRAVRGRVRAPPYARRGHAAVSSPARRLRARAVRLRADFAALPHRAARLVAAERRDAQHPPLVLDRHAPRGRSGSRGADAERRREGQPILSAGPTER